MLSARRETRISARLMSLVRRLRHKLRPELLGHSMAKATFSLGGVLIPDRRAGNPGGDSERRALHVRRCYASK